MKKTLIILFIFLAPNLFGQQNLNFKISGLKDTTVFLARYFGEKLYYADTAYSKNETVIFDKKNLARKECLLLPLRATLKALKI